MPCPHICYPCHALSSVRAINTHTFILPAICVALRAFKFEPKPLPKFHSRSSSLHSPTSAIKGSTWTPFLPSSFCLKPQPLARRCSSGMLIAAAFALISLFGTFLEELIVSYHVPNLLLPIPQLYSSDSPPWSPTAVGPSGLRGCDGRQCVGAAAAAQAHGRTASAMFRWRVSNGGARTISAWAWGTHRVTWEGRSGPWRRCDPVFADASAC